MPRKQDRSEHWFLGYPFDLDQVEFGGIGSGNIASLNAIFFEQWVLDVERRGDAIKQMLANRLSFWSKLVLHGLPWRALVRTGIQGLVDLGGNLPWITVSRSRPWKLEIGNLVNLQVKFGWKVRVLQGCGLLLVALLPILKKILAACQVRPGQLFIKSIVGLYVLVDLACLVMAWLLCAAAPMAYHAGAAIKAIALSYGQVATQILKDIEHVTNKDVQEHLPGAVVGGVQDRVPAIAPVLKENFVPALRWNMPFFMEPLVFLAASAVLAVGLYGAHWSAGVSAGVCGPLWLVSDDAKSRERQVDSTRGLYFMMVSRSLLLAGIVVLLWKVVYSVDALSVQILFAGLCNRILSITEATYWWTCWVAICAVHCLFGLAAAYAAKENLEESSEGATRSEVLTAEEYLRATYGTFDPTVWTCKAGNLNKSLIRLISIRKAALSTVANMSHVCLLDTNHHTSWPLF